MSRHLLVSAIFLLLLSIPSGKAQETEIHHDILESYKKGLELYNKKKYNAAQAEFAEVMVNVKDKYSDIRMDAQYQHALCALELLNKDAEHLFREFMRQHPHSPRSRYIPYYLGEYNHSRGKYKKAIQWLEDTDPNDLKPEERTKYHFMLGYSYFEKGKMEKSQMQLYKIKDKPSTYQAPALFYYSHIVYEQGKYQTALQGFLKLVDDEKFGKVTPYYIAQIYYQQKQYDELIKFAPPLLKNANTKRGPEIARMLAEAYFRKEQYDKALPYLEVYHKYASKLSNEDKYLIAYSYYKSENYKKALPLFAEIADEDSQLGQMATYYLADCYLRNDQKEYAVAAFRQASQLDYDTEIKENALYNYAKTSYETSLDPYHEAIRAFKQYIDDHPDSPNRDEAYKYLLNAYLSSNEFQLALEAIEKLSFKDIKTQRAYQQIAYARAVELYNQPAKQQEQVVYNMQRAVDHFEKSQKYPLDSRLTALTNYWMAESYSKMRKWDKAEDYYNRFRVTSGAMSLPQYNEIYYNIGYLHFHQKNFPKASEAFRNYVAERPKDKRKLNDTYLRLGDTHLQQKKYDEAINYYAKAIKANQFDTDYALMQLAFAHEVNPKSNSKKSIQALQRLTREFPNSSYFLTAQYQMGTIMIANKDYDNAAKQLELVVANAGQDMPLKQKALVKKAFIRNNQGNKKEALEIFESAISLDPSSDMSQEALKSYKDICGTMGNPERYFKLRKKLNLPDENKEANDFYLYNIAFEFYNKGECETAINKFKSYIAEYPQGMSLMKAHFYKSECQYKMGSYNEAYAGYKNVLDKPRNEFSEIAALRSGLIQEYNLNFDKALRHYDSVTVWAINNDNRHIAAIGLMRCHHLLDNHHQAINYSKEVLKSEKNAKDINVEAHFYIGYHSAGLERFDVAIHELDTVTKMTKMVIGAEAKYHLARIHLERDSLDLAQAKIYELAKQVPSYKHWISKSFILLAEINLRRKEFFQGKQILQTVITNTKDEELKAEAQAKLKELEKAEEADKQAKIKPEEEITIDLEGNGEEEEGDTNEKKNSPDPAEQDSTKQDNQPATLKEEGGNRGQ